MQTVEDKLIWIANFAIMSDAALEAEIGFVGAAKSEELHHTVVDELEMSSFGFKTRISQK